LGSADPDFIVELFAGFGPVSVRRMFSGAGVFADGLMIALAVDGVIYLKADDSFVPLFAREGQTPFSYKTRDGKRTLMSYWRMPERLYDDPDELAQWARQALAAARQAAVKPSKRRKVS
jgi:DNA transformation protein